MPHICPTSSFDWSQKRKYQKLTHSFSLPAISSQNEPLRCENNVCINLNNHVQNLIFQN